MIGMKIKSLLYRPVLITALVISCISAGVIMPGQTSKGPGNSPDIETRISELLGKMTLEEKLGQLHFVVGDIQNTGPTLQTKKSNVFDDQIRNGEITGIFNIYGADYIRGLQKIAVEESRLGIPLLIGADVIHGLKTIFPIPLGEAASWDLELIEKTAAAAALESAASGINWTFAPMVDICRDARWGRVAEGAGEDPYLASLVAAARVKGFQGSDLSSPTTIAACVKHFAAYGAPEGGREYNSVDMSEHRLRSVYLPPYKAGVEAGAASIMTAFNDLNGIPVTGNKWLLRDILREEWGFEGVVVSDWHSIIEMEFHGYAEDKKEASLKGMEAGCNVDMMGSGYSEELYGWIENGELAVSYIDEAVRNVLRMKFELGLFDDPYAYSQPERERSELRTAAHRELAREAARKSIVLLKNKDQILPLKGTENIALIGPFGDDQAEHNGTWSLFSEQGDVVSMVDGLHAQLGAGKLSSAKGCGFFERNETELKKALDLANSADVVLLALGETALMNGEAGSRTDIGLPDAQQELLEAVVATGKPTVLLLTHGRPMDLSWMDEHVDAILACWTLGSETGNAIADVVFGKYNPGGRLPISFPRNVGQVPIYYSQKATGRYYEGDNTEPLTKRIYRSRYIDVHFSPLYPFGYGLSYTSFNYSGLTLSDSLITGDQTLLVEVDVTNKGAVNGEETVQLYLRDPVASMTRPMRELKDFRKVMVPAGETVRVQFEISKETLAFYNADMEWVTEPGRFEVYVGPNAEEGLQGKFYWKDDPAEQ